MATWLGAGWAVAACGGDAAPAQVGDVEPDATSVEPVADSAIDSAPDLALDSAVDASSESADAPTDVDAPDVDAPDLEAPDVLDVPDDTTDADSAAADAGPDAPTPDATTCVADSPCTFQGYLPFCYEARCNDRGTCIANRVAGCCLADVDCALPDAGPCDTVRCLQNTCTALHIPGCCDVDLAGACDDGTSLTTDACDRVASRCTSCSAACGYRPAIFAATFDADTQTPSALGFFVADQQPGDAVTWQRTGDAFAAGGGSVYLGDPRCHTYFGGALDADCEPLNDTGQDSARIVVGLYTPFVTLPPESPAVLTAWLRSAVEPLAQLGAGEPDVLRIQVETLGAQATVWVVASTLDVGKSTEWVPIAVDLAAWRGQTIRLRFDFDTLDGENNRHEGVWLDEIIVREACSEGGCCDDDTDCGGASACTRGACLLTSQGASRVCATIAISPGELCTPCASDEACADADPCTHDACLPSGTCGNDTFCCLERDLFAESFDASLGSLAAFDDNPLDGVSWSVRDHAAWFGDAITGTYGSATRVSGALATPPLALPERLAPRARAVLALTVSLSTEWDLAEPGNLSALDNPAGLDRLTIEVHDGAFVTLLWSSDQIGGTTFDAPLPLELDLGPWLGRTISVHIRFDSGDETLNAFAGAYLDDLVLGLRCD